MAPCSPCWQQGWPAFSPIAAPCYLPWFPSQAIQGGALGGVLWDLCCLTGIMGGALCLGPMGTAGVLGGVRRPLHRVLPPPPHL
jgi:hypothetical protein